MIYDEAQDALAAEYVLGTLSGDEREHAEALLAIDPGFAESVRQWERRLGELNVMVEAVEPPPEVWNKIKAELGHGAAPGAAAATPSAPELPKEQAPPAPPQATSPVPLATQTPAMTSLAPPTLPAPANASPAAATTAPNEDSFGSLASIIPQESQDKDTEAQASDSSSSESVSDSIAAALKKSFAEPGEPAEFPPAREPAPEPRIVDNTAEVIYLSRRVNRWRRVASLTAALAAVLAVYIALSDLVPRLVGFRDDVTAEFGGQLPARLVAVLQQEPTAPAFLLTVDPQSRTLVVRRISATPEQGRSYQLWLIAKQFPTPRSLGVIGNDEFTERSIPRDFDLATLRSANYAISLEPSGGSPTGVPTGPVLFTGSMVESVPSGATPRT